MKKLVILSIVLKSGDILRVGDRVHNELDEFKNGKTIKRIRFKRDGVTAYYNPSVDGSHYLIDYVGEGQERGLTSIVNEVIPSSEVSSLAFANVEEHNDEEQVEMKKEN